MSHANALREVTSHSKEYNIIFITNPGDPFYKSEMRGLIAHAKESLVCQFNDIEFNTVSRNGPQTEDVKTILEFANGKDDLIVCCHAGVSRSSASAFVIACSREDPEEAVKILDVHKHDPNGLIIKHGAELLDKPTMVEVIQGFKARKMEEVY